MAKELIALGARSVIGMVHCLPLPGSFGYAGDMEKILSQAVQDAQTLEKAGADAIIVENMGDTPFTAKLNKAQIAALAAAARKVADAVSIPVGVDAAFNDYEASLSIAAAAGATFIRVPVFVDTVVFTDGIIYPCAHDCVNYRKQMGLEHIKILADCQVKHSYMLCPSISIEVSAKNAAEAGADGIIITGATIGEETPIEMSARAKKVVKIPVFAGSGVKPGNVREQLDIADGCIVGSSFKKGGVLTNPIDYTLARELIEAKG